jgi:hypothetical protein
MFQALFAHVLEGLSKIYSSFNVSEENIRCIELLFGLELFSLNSFVPTLHFLTSQFRSSFLILIYKELLCQGDFFFC